MIKSGKVAGVRTGKYSQKYEGREKKKGMIGQIVRSEIMSRTGRLEIKEFNEG